MLSSIAFSLVASQAYYFYSIGDWGGIDKSPYSTELERNIAKGMDAASGFIDGASSQPAFVLFPGDNFYSTGIQGDEYSSRFQATFEDVFSTSYKSLNVPFYAVAGNHDHKGNVTAQIEYAKHQTRWTYPNQWYTFTETHGGVSTQVVMIDTVTLVGMMYFDDLTGEFVKPHYHPAMEKKDEQLAWLEATLAASKADYLWVSGHYPVYSQCSHGPTESLINDVLPLLKKYKASGYISGHDHCSGYYFDEELHYVVAGAGKECCYNPDNLHSTSNPGEPLFRMDSQMNKADAGGFASFAVNETHTEIKFHKAASGSGGVQYSALVTPRSYPLVES